MADKRKELGQYATPPEIADLMVRWASRGGEAASFLDPAVGPGVFVRAYLARRDAAGGSRVIGYEIDPSVPIDAPSFELRREDYLKSRTAERYAAIAGNPPYIKHRFIPEKKALAGELGRDLGAELPPTLNAYCLFLLKSLLQLEPGGRLAYLVPSEFLSADFGAPVKELLLDRGGLRAVICLAPELRVFEGALTTAAIVLCENAPPPAEVELVWAPRLESLEAVFARLGRGGGAPPAGVLWRRAPRRDLDPREKWQRPPAFVPPSGAGTLADYGRCLRGIATGNNEFFLLSASELAAHGLTGSHVRPCVARAADVRGPVFTKKDFARLSEAGRKCFLLDVGERPDPAARRYLALGEARGVHKLYLPSRRDPWHAPESRPPADFWLPTFFRESWRVARNAARTLHLTAYHGFYLNALGKRHADRLFAYLNSEKGLAAAKAAARTYGGGLNKLEPRDASKISVPVFS